MARKNAVNWSEHFARIRSVCPWSWQAWQQGEILIVTYDQGLRPLAPYKAIVYVSGRNARQTKKFAKQFTEQDPSCEFLVSDRTYGPMGTPVPVIIQQDLKTLQYLRLKLGVKN